MMIGKSKIALIVLALASLSVPALAHEGWAYRGHHHGWHHRHHSGWYRHGYAPAVSDAVHHSRMLVGTR